MLFQFFLLREGVGLQQGFFGLQQVLGAHGKAPQAQLQVLGGVGRVAHGKAADRHRDIALFGGALWCWWNSIISIGTVILIGAAVLAVIGISWISISLENGLTAAGVIAVTALAFNLLLINEVAVPFSSLRSDKEIGLELAQSYRAVDEIGVYGKYSTSAVFYSGKKIIKLVPDEDLANFAPKAYSWKVKNVMPFEGINSFGWRGQLLLVKKNEAGKFLNGSNGKWLVTGEKGGWYILKSA